MLTLNWTQSFFIAPFFQIGQEEVELDVLLAVPVGHRRRIRAKSDTGGVEQSAVLACALHHRWERRRARGRDEDPLGGVPAQHGSAVLGGVSAHFMGT